MYKIIVTGNTFPIKCFLKDQDFFWNHLTKEWEKIVDDKNFPVYIPKNYSNTITIQRLEI